MCETWGEHTCPSAALQRSIAQQLSAKPWLSSRALKSISSSHFHSRDILMGTDDEAAR